MGLVIWAWAALHLSQQEQAAKVCVHARMHARTHAQQDTHTHTHTIWYKYTQIIGGRETGALSAVPLCHTSVQKIDCVVQQHPAGTTLRLTQYPEENNLPDSSPYHLSTGTCLYKQTIGSAGNSLDDDSLWSDRPLWINISVSPDNTWMPGHNHLPVLKLQHFMISTHFL